MLSNMLKDKVTLIKKDGERYENIKASVQKEIIFIDDASLPIEENDRFIRKLSNGLEESYIIIDRGFYEKFSGVNAHYQCEVQKETSQQFKQWASNVTTYNFHGSNSRVNVNSTDNSTNTVNISKENVFSELKFALQQGITSDEGLDELLASVDDMEASKGSPAFTSKYQRFIDTAASHMTVIAPFIPMLSHFLS